MTPIEYADIINTNIIITYYHNQSNRYSAHFESCEILKDGILNSAYGNSNNPIDALNNYISKIRGKRIVFYAMSKNHRKEMIVPLSITPLLEF